MRERTYKSLLHEMAETTPTQFWDDSCGYEDLTNSIDDGATGATSNPVIVGNVFKEEFDIWSLAVAQIAAKNPTYGEVEVAQRIIVAMGARGANMLHSTWEENNRRGRISLQVNPQHYRCPATMYHEALSLASIAPNVQVKMPITQPGIVAVERATENGISINGTVGFSVAQSIAFAEAVERGLKRREEKGWDMTSMSPVCTIMVGRLDDWLKQVQTNLDETAPQESLNWAGIAVVKRTYEIFQERSFRTKVLVGAFRGEHHWSELMGGDIILTIPPAIQDQFNGSDVQIASRIEHPVDSEIMKDLGRHGDFVRAYEPGGMGSDEFESFAPSRATLRQFLKARADFLEMIRDVMLPAPAP